MYRIIRQSERVRLQQKIDVCGAIIGLIAMGIFTIAWFISDVGIFD